MHFMHIRRLACRKTFFSNLKITPYCRAYVFGRVQTLGISLVGQGFHGDSTYPVSNGRDLYVCHVYGRDIGLGFQPRIADYPANRLVLIYFILFNLIGNAVTKAAILTVRIPREWTEPEYRVFMHIVDRRGHNLLVLRLVCLRSTSHLPLSF